MDQMSLLGMLMQSEEYKLLLGLVETPLVSTVNHASIQIEVMTANITHDPVMSWWLHSTAMPRQQQLVVKKNNNISGMLCSTSVSCFGEARSRCL